MRQRYIVPLNSGTSDSTADTWPALDKVEKWGNLCMKSGAKQHDIAKIAVEKGDRASLRGIRPVPLSNIQAERDTEAAGTTDRTTRVKPTRNASCMCPSKGSD